MLVLLKGSVCDKRYYNAFFSAGNTAGLSAGQVAVTDAGFLPMLPPCQCACGVDFTVE